MPDTLEAVLDRGIAEGLDDAELRLLAKEYQSSSQPWDGGIGYVMETLGNIPRSAGQAVEGTLGGVAALGKGLLTDPVGRVKGLGPGILAHYGDRYGSGERLRNTIHDDPVGMLLDALPVAGAISKAPAMARGAASMGRSAAASTASAVAKHPRAVSTVAGAAMGSPGGLGGILGGGAAGYQAGPGVGRVAQRVAEALRPATSAPAAAPTATATASQVPLLDALMRGAKFDELNTANQAMRAGRPVATVTRTVDPMATELAARARLAAPIDWEATDVVSRHAAGPHALTANKGLIFPGESTPGLMKMLKSAQLKGDTTLIERLQKALRQRGHVTGKSGN